VTYEIGKEFSKEIYGRTECSSRLFWGMESNESNIKVTNVISGEL
jgi:hypothetical protein